MGKQVEYNNLISEFKEKIRKWTSRYDLRSIPLYKTYEYELINTFVFNHTLENRDITKITHIFAADNPGLKEQAACEYLIGQAGKVMRNYFTRMGMAIDKEVLILNKTPIHTKSTTHLITLDKDYRDILIETQHYMAELIYKLHRLTGCKLYLFGFGGSRRPDGKWLYKKNKKELFKSQFTPYFFERLIELYKDENELYERFYIFKHFANGNFNKDLNALSEITDVNEKLEIIGKRYRDELFKVLQ